MRISKRPIDPNNLDLRAMVTETFEAIAADPTIALKVIEDVAYLSRTRDDQEVVHERGLVLDGLVEDVAAAMHENYDRECAAADAYSSRAATISALASGLGVQQKTRKKKMSAAYRDCSARLSTTIKIVTT
jgi:hypothetical protein